MITLDQLAEMFASIRDNSEWDFAALNTAKIWVVMRVAVLLPCLATLLIACGRQEQLRIDRVGYQDGFIVNFSSPVTGLDSERFYLLCDLGFGFWPDGETPGPRFYMIGMGIEKNGTSRTGWQSYQVLMSFESTDRDQHLAVNSDQVKYLLYSQNKIDCHLAAKSWFMGQPDLISNAATLPRQGLVENKNWTNF